MERIAACYRLGAALQMSQACEWLPVRGSSLRHLSFLASHQGRSERVSSQSRLPCLVHKPISRQGMTLSRRRHRVKPRYQEDGVSPNMKIIYENNMYQLTYFCQVMVNALAVPVYGMSIKVLVSAWHLQDWSLTSAPVTAMCYMGTYGCLLFGVNNLCKRNICRMYADENVVNFAAVVQDWNMMNKTIHFDLSCVQRKIPSKFFGSFFGNLRIKKQSYLANSTDFVLPKFYNVLFGYDQHPIDLDQKDVEMKNALPDEREESGKPEKVTR